MSYPNKRSQTYSYTAFQQSQGNNSFPGTNMDQSLADLKASIDEQIDFTTATFTSVGTLQMSALPTGLDVAAYSNIAAAVSAANATNSATAAAASATSAATSASSASTTLANVLVKANNLSDLPNAATARTNLGLGTAATTASTAYATAAQGAKADSALQTLPVGTVVQVVNTQTGAYATGTTTIPMDDTIPQNTEGDQYMSLAITPTSSTNKLRIDVVVMVANSSASAIWLIAALFQDSTAGALAADAIYQGTANGGGVIKFTHYMTAGTTSATTFKVRAGGSGAGSTYFNGQSASRYLGGVMASSITITEVKA